MFICTIKKKLRVIINKLNEFDHRKAKERKAFIISICLIVIISEITHILLNMLPTNFHNYTYIKILAVCKAIIIFFLVFYNRATQKVIYIALSIYIFISIFVILLRVV